ncbi:MAG: hypothetical protein M5U28_51490 [Sandaracinaceae bacterium]|nr:hypothetical protein [Sandaracinaceae bacterium]
MSALSAEAAASDDPFLSTHAALRAALVLAEQQGAVAPALDAFRPVFAARPDHVGALLAVEEIYARTRDDEGSPRRTRRWRRWCATRRPSWPRSRSWRARAPRAAARPPTCSGASCASRPTTPPRSRPSPPRRTRAAIARRCSPCTRASRRRRTTRPWAPSTRAASASCSSPRATPAARSRPSARRSGSIRAAWPRRAG